jgi:predicted phage baseplate assembly protein
MMGLSAPKLDDRQFQDIVDEAKKRIPQYCPEWTDHNVSDPGVTLIELFAWMTEVLLYRLNQVPERHYIKFLEMLGITLSAPVPSNAPVTFWLSAPQPTAVVIPAGTEVASIQTETQHSIVFTTDTDLHIQIPKLKAIISWIVPDGVEKGGYCPHATHGLKEGVPGKGVQVFSSAPQVDDALFFGFENDLSHHVLRFEMDFDPAGGAGVKPAVPPYRWEAATGAQGNWIPCEVETDTTGGMNRAGRIQIHLPRLSKRTVDGQKLYWVRVRNTFSLASHPDDVSPYLKSPWLRQVSVASWGGTVPATHAQQITREFLGQSDGSSSQRFRLQCTPILERQPGEALLVQVEGEPTQIWTEVPDFALSRTNDRHYTLDSVTGELRLAPAVRQPDGSIRLYGAVPPRGANLIFARYRVGGGQEGNLQAGVLNTLKTAIPYIARVSNLQAASGGLDAETLESAKMRAPAMLRTRDRAVTEVDFEFLAQQALPQAIGRVKCLQPRPSEAGRVVPGTVFVLVIPKVPQPEGYLAPDQLELHDEHVDVLAAYLDERRLLTTRLDIRTPAYQWVAVKVRLRAVPGVDLAQIEVQVIARLRRFLNPLTGGPDGTGWPFGRDLFVSDVCQCLQGLPHVQFIRDVEMYEAHPGGGTEGKPRECIDVLGHGVIASGLHSVEFI